jgi:hypothetical protein
MKKANKFKLFWSKFFSKLAIDISEKIKDKNDIQKLEMDIIHQLFYGQAEKLNTNESILLFDKIYKNFVNEINSRELSAIDELKIINDFKKLNNIS